MKHGFRPVDLKRVKPLSIADRPSKVKREDLGRVVGGDASVRDLVESFPRQLAANDWRELLIALRRARAEGRLILAMMGGHVIKCGLGPILIDLMRDYIGAVALNGAAAIHDVELAVWGKTSEDVPRGLAEGKFGMAEETANLMNEAAVDAAAADRGMGETLGEMIRGRVPEAAGWSVLAGANHRGIPATVHVAVGTDVVHQHPSADGAAIGAATFFDFRLLASVVGGLGKGGVVLHFGSAVILPEVFLKALTVARNVGGGVEGFVTADFDFIRQYRPQENVVRRPTADGGRGFSFVGHHEILIPLLAASLRAEQS